MLDGVSSYARCRMADCGWTGRVGAIAECERCGSPYLEPVSEPAVGQARAVESPLLDAAVDLLERNAVALGWTPRGGSAREWVASRLAAASGVEQAAALRTVGVESARRAS